MIDLLGFIGNELNRRQRAGESAASRSFAQQELAARLRESEKERAARLAEDERRLALERERLGQGESQFARNLAAQESELSRRLGLERDNLTMRGTQFDRNLAQGQSEFDRQLELEREQQAAREKLANQEYLARLAEQTGSYDILNLIGGQVGVPGLGSRLGLSKRSLEEFAGLQNRKPAATQWNFISGMIEPQNMAWQSWLAKNAPNTATIAMSPEERATRNRR